MATTRVAAEDRAAPRHQRAVVLQGGERATVPDHGVHAAQQVHYHAAGVAAPSRIAPRYNRTINLVYL